MVNTKQDADADLGLDFGERRESCVSAGAGAGAGKESVSVEEWVDVWGETVGRARNPAATTLMPLLLSLILTKLYP